MKIGIFAAGEVGLKIVSIFSNRGKKIECLILSDHKKNDLNNQIQKTANCENIFYNRDLYKTQVLESLKSLNIDLMVLAWWPHIIKPPLFCVSRMGFLNTHPSLLPHNRGKHYFFWNLVEDVPFGVTLHWIDENIDQGDIAFQKELDTSWEDTGFSLRERAIKAIGILFEENFDLIFSGNIPKRKQDLEKGSFRWRREIEDASKIDLGRLYSGEELLNLIRGLSGFSSRAAWFEAGNTKYEVTLSIKKVMNE